MSSSESMETVTCKVVMLGESGVGKTSISNRYSNDVFQDIYAPTLNSAFLSKEVPYEKYNKIISFQIWDTAGQEKYRSVNKMMYADANIVFLVYDVTRIESFNEIKDYWFDEVKEKAPESALIVVLGNKSDLYEDEEVPKDEAESYTLSKGGMFFTVSAKSGSLIADAFYNAGKRLLDPNDTTLSLVEAKKEDCLVKKNSIRLSRNTYIPKSKKEKKVKKCC